LDDRTTEVDGLAIHYWVAGSGPPLILLHGLGESAHDWRWVIPAFALTYRVYALDMPGSGESAKPAVNYTPAYLTRMVIGFLDALGIGPALMIGHSLGGLIALRLAVYQPERVRALVLVDGRSMHHCPYCAGWEVRDQALAIYGRGEKGRGLALMLTVWSEDPFSAPTARRVYLMKIGKGSPTVASRSTKNGSRVWKGRRTVYSNASCLPTATHSRAARCFSTPGSTSAPLSLQNWAVSLPIRAASALGRTRIPASPASTSLVMRRATYS
jgi:pimeloyl-ACP methyl ester carboxylesterase